MNTKPRILYLTFNDPYVSPGVYRKESGFCRAMHEICKEPKIQFKGIDIFASEYCNVSPLPDLDYFELREVDDRLHKIFAKMRFVRAFFRIRPVFQAAYEEIKRFNPSIIICRYNTTYLPAPFNPKRVKPDILFISEHQAKEIEELRMSFFDRVMLPIERIKARKFFKNVDGIVAVTSEIAKHEVARANRDIPYFVLPNGIDVGKYPLKSYVEFKGDLLKMVFVGLTTSKWHGLDRLLMGMKNYQGNVRLELHIVGSVVRDIKDLVRLLNLEKNVIFHGLRYGKELDKTFDNVHIAIGTLGIHREKLKYGSTLKVREYMARGVPFVISYIDEDIEEEFPLILRLPPNDNPVNMDEVIRFAKRVYEKYRRAIPSIMRNYALKKMDYKVKVNKLLNFILKLLNSQE